MQQLAGRLGNGGGFDWCQDVYCTWGYFKSGCGRPPRRERAALSNPSCSSTSKSGKRTSAIASKRGTENGTRRPLGAAARVSRRQLPAWSGFGRCQPYSPPYPHAYERAGCCRRVLSEVLRDRLGRKASTRRACQRPAVSTFHGVHSVIQTPYCDVPLRDPRDSHQVSILNQHQIHCFLSKCALRILRDAPLVL